MAFICSCNAGISAILGGQMAEVQIIQGEIICHGEKTRPGEIKGKISGEQLEANAKLP